MQQERKRDVNLHLLAGKSETEVPYYWIEGTGISTVRRDYADRHKASGFKITEMTLPVKTLKQVLAQYVGSKTIDFLKIDVEGAEEDVIDGMDWKTYRPRILVIEAVEPNSTKPAWQEWESKLLANNYGLAYFDGLNRYYIRSEELEALLPCFSTPLNIFDNFMLYQHAKAKELNEAYEQYNQSAIFKIARFIYGIKSRF